MDPGASRPPRQFGKSTNTAPSAPGAARSVPHSRGMHRQTVNVASFSYLPRVLGPMHCGFVQINQPLDAMKRRVLPCCSDNCQWSSRGHEIAAESINDCFSLKGDQ